MTYRLPDLDIPPDEPFRNDALERKPVVEFLCGLIERAGGPFVVALDSPWGSGKTTLVRMLQSELKRQNHQCVYFNAWQVDYVTDPLVALVASIDRLELFGEAPAATFRSHMKTVRRVTTLVAKRAAVAAAKAITVGALDLDEEIEAAASELAGEAMGDIVGAFQKEKELLEKLRAELKAAIDQLPVSGKKPTLVFFIDELDRCRPTFAIELLERIKHLFDMANIVFVLSIDKKQLEASTAAVYGQGINASEYLRRFIDIEYALPLARGTRFTEVLFARFMLDEIFAKRTHDELRYDRKQFIEFFTTLADAIQLSLRARERCMTRLRIVMDQTPENNFLFPPLVALLIVLRATQPDLFAALRNGVSTAADVMAYLSKLPGGVEIVAGRSGVVMEIGLLLADENRERKQQALAELQKAAEVEKTKQVPGRASDLLETVRYFQNFHSDGPRLGYLLDKIDLSSGLRN